MKDSYTAILNDLSKVIKRVEVLQKKEKKLNQKIAHERDKLKIKKIRQSINQNP